MDWPLIIREILSNSFRITLLLTAILVPLMLGLALLQDSRILDRAAASVQPVMQRLKLSNKAAFPLLAGLFLGLVFGSGIIISFARDSSLTKRDLTLVMVFLGVCHSIIEDSVVFIALGANWWVLISARFLLAASAAIVVAWLLRLKPDAGVIPQKFKS